jgi:hypothetical protein
MSFHQISFTSGENIIDFKVFNNEIYYINYGVSPYINKIDSNNNYVTVTGGNTQILINAICISANANYIYCGNGGNSEIYQIQISNGSILTNYVTNSSLTNIKNIIISGNNLICSDQNNNMGYLPIPFTVNGAGGGGSITPTIGITGLILYLLQMDTYTYVSSQPNKLYKLDTGNNITNPATTLVLTTYSYIWSIATYNGDIYGILYIGNNINQLCKLVDNAFVSIIDTYNQGGEQQILGFANENTYITNVAFSQTDTLGLYYINTLCFNKGTKILCMNQQLEDEYIPIENLNVGDFVKTYKHGYRNVSKTIKGAFVNNPKKWNMCMYKMAKTESNGLLEDLIVTGGHSILVDSLSDVEREKYEEMGIPHFANETIDKKHLVLSCVSDQFTPMQDTSIYHYYHLLLENNDDEEERFGIWANGILTETPNVKTVSK